MVHARDIDAARRAARERQEKRSNDGRQFLHGDGRRQGPPAQQTSGVDVLSLRAREVGSAKRDRVE
ncbi:MAG: hypothetical protein AAB426_00865 [Myxococcota bacterium]